MIYYFIIPDDFLQRAILKNTIESAVLHGFFDEDGHLVHDGAILIDLAPLTKNGYSYKELTTAITDMPVKCVIKDPTEDEDFFLSTISFTRKGLTWASKHGFFQPNEDFPWKQFIEWLRKEKIIEV